MSDPPLGARLVLDVVAGIVWRNAEVLVAQRPPGKHLAGLWEFPGGKIEPGESPERALRREIEEELGILVEVIALRRDVTHAYPERTVRLRFYDCRFVGGEARNLGVADHRWLAPRHLGTLPFPDADRELIDELVTRGSAQGP